ncbi:SNF2 family helicase [Paecilomyces variotii No. 5]|uniref:SNF2 family helicase n=1 Tax=Byssochlamys spectabilis (strain No. 5 / NBRC 109023) TaxID=1356009 RepID=V5G1E1_BYSSN|nr:SNF2 family helicase [Paecilomyces variotii No. 5]
MEDPGDTEPSPAPQETPELESTETPHVDTRAEETIEERRKQALTKGKLALARLKLNQRLRNETSASAEYEKTHESTTHEAPTENNAIINVPTDNLTLTHVSANNESQDCEVESENELLESSEYENLEKWYVGLRRPTIEDTIKWQRAKFEEETRKKRLLDRRSLKENDEQPVDNQLFCSEDEGEAPVPPGGPQVEGEGGQVASDDLIILSQPPNGHQPTNKRRKTNRISAEERRGSLQLGLDIALSRSKRTTNKQSFGKTISGPTRSLGRRSNRARKTNIGQSVYGKPQNKKRRSKANDVDFGSLFQTDIIGDAHESSTKPVHTFTKRNKDDALAELIASIPTADRTEATPDKKLIIEATRKFTRLAKSDGNGGWRIKGMETSLYNYQILGAAFMRDRENGPKKPYGGFLCDVMGASQIQRHCKKGVLGSVLLYHGKSKIISQDTVNDLQMFGVIITTYDEVRRSYPDFKPPDELTSESQIQAWWEDTYKKYAGPLHQIKFRRIVLDEGHYIKNPESKVSIAVRALIGHYKWILSGTPVHNGNVEFFPYLDFLKAPHIGRYEVFINNYCNGDELSNMRLVNILKPIMFRRTHSARLFAMPILKLPDIGQRTVQVELCDAENKVYNWIIKMFIERINGLSEPKRVECQYRCILTMILKLRMFTSHLLTVQDVLKEIITQNAIKDLEALRKNQTDLDDPSVTIVNVLIALTSGAAPAEPPKPPEPKGPWGDQSAETRNRLITEFREIMTDLHYSEAWDERLARTTCPGCGSVPIDACVTSCMHLYCEECLLILDQCAQEQENTKRICASCGEEIVETAQCGSVDDLNIDSTPPSSQSSRGNKQSRSTKSKTKKRKRALEHDGDHDNSDDEFDWISVAGHIMPSAKLTAMTETIAEWISADPETKIVVFTQFQAVIRIVSAICQREGWGYTCLTGKMSIPSREKAMMDFRESADLRIMIASLKAGGVGLDLTMANKCILIDPWWNEAVQQQAYCRLFRIGQERNVEVVKLVVKGSIDEYMIDLQNRKSVEIDKTIGDAALSDRATVAELLKMFGRVEEDEDGVLRVIPDAEEQQE